MRSPKELSSDSLMVGKTVKAVRTNFEYLLILFTDDTFSRYEAVVEWDLKYINECKEGLLTFDQEVLVELGIVTQEEIDNYHREKESKNSYAALEQKRQQYEELKKIFEPNELKQES